MSRALLSKTLTFTAGLAVGSVVTWKLLDDKYRKIADEEIASVKEAFSNKNKEEESETDISEEDPEPEVKVKPAAPVKENYNRFVNDLGYTNYSDIPKVQEDRPYLIKSEEYGELYDYTEICLTYYADGVLADDMDELVEDVDNVVGLESLKHFGDYEDDAVFVRNDRLKCDYEISQDVRKYSDVIGSSHPMEG